MQREDNRELAERSIELRAQCRKHEENLSEVNECLDVIEKDSVSAQLTKLTTETLDRARQCVRDSLDLQTRADRLHNIGAWLHMSAVRV